MALILSIETSTYSCSAALHNDGSLVANRETQEPQKAASQLALQIKEVLNDGNVNAGDLAAVAVSAGPGSYTGLRIGVATAKGLCYGLNIPLIAVNSLVLLAAQARVHAQPDDLLCPMIDARRMEVYTMVLDTKLLQVEPISARIIDSGSYQELLAIKRVLFFGTGSDKCRQVIDHPNASFISGIVPSAKSMGSLAYERFKRNQLEDVSAFEPFYLKDFLIRKPKSLV